MERTAQLFLECCPVFTKMTWNVQFYFILIYLFILPFFFLFSYSCTCSIWLYLLSYSAATATRDVSHLCDLQHTSWQCRIHNPVSKARDRTQVFVDTSRVRYHWATTGSPGMCNFSILFYFILLFFFVFCPFRAVPAAYGGSQARGLIGAVAPGPCQSHSNARSKPYLWPTPQLTAMPDS